MFAQLAANGLLGPSPMSGSAQGVSSSVPSSRSHEPRSAGPARHSGHGFHSPPMLSRSYAPGFPGKSKHSNSLGQHGYPPNDLRPPINTSFDFAKPHPRSAAHSRNHSGSSQYEGYGLDLGGLPSNAGLPPSLWMSPTSTAPSTPSIEQGYGPFTPHPMPGALYGHPSLAAHHPDFDASSSAATSILSDVLHENLFSAGSTSGDPATGFTSPLMPGSPGIQDVLGDTELLSKSDTQVRFLSPPLFEKSLVPSSFFHSVLLVASASSDVCTETVERAQNITWRMEQLRIQKQREDEARAQAAAGSDVKNEPTDDEGALGDTGSGGRGRARDKGKTKVSIVGFDGTNQDGDGEDDNEDEIPMDWRAMSRSRSRVAMDWRPLSRSRSRPPPADAPGSALHPGAFGDPLTAHLPPFDNPSRRFSEPQSNGRPGSPHGGYGGLPALPEHANEDALRYAFPSLPSLDGAGPDFHAHLHHGGHPSSLPAAYGLGLFPASFDAHHHHHQHHPHTQQGFPRHVRKTSFDHTVSRESMLPPAPGGARHQVDGRPAAQGAMGAMKRRADAHHGDSLLRGDPASIPGPGLSLNLNLGSIPRAGPPTPGGPRSPYAFGSGHGQPGGYDGFFELGNSEYAPVMPTSDEVRHPAALSAAAAAVEAAYREQTAQGGPGEFDYGVVGVGGLMGLGPYGGLGMTSMGMGAYGTVDPGQIMGPPANEPSPSSDGWGTRAGGQSSSTASPEPAPSGRVVAGSKRAGAARGVRPSASTPDLRKEGGGGGKGEKEKKDGAEVEEREVSVTVCTNCSTTNTPLWRRDPEGLPLFQTQYERTTHHLTPFPFSSSP
ncbi:hypothetical protein PENSPDRAFT_448069 [Peniophora sp. CONT]|nr:hypothetical protein PENSPDRAFT_448069 [Peniophora sp. CONT]